MIPLAELKAHLRVTHDSEDAYIESLERAAVAEIEKRTGRYYGSAGEHTLYLTGDGTSALWLPYEPTLNEFGDYDIHAIEYATPGGEGSDIFAVADDGFVVRGRKLVRKSGVWTLDYEYAIELTRGADTTEASEDIVGRVRDLVALWYTHRTPSDERAVAEAAIYAMLPSNPVLA